MVGVGAMVGAGIFVLCGVAMQVSGPAAILAFALNGVVTLITAFAELAATFPEAGGGYVFAKKGLPEGNIIIEESVNPVEAIVRHSREADLILLGLGQRGGRTRLIGDFALAVVGGAHCPVVAIAQARR